VPPTELIKLTTNEDSLIAEVLKGRKKSLSQVVPEDIDPREALANISRCVSALNKLGNASSLIGAYLGQHMAIMARRPEIHQAAGYDTLDEYERAEVLDKISHGGVWVYKRIAEVFPDLTLEEIPKIGSTNLDRAAKVCKSAGATPAQKKKILEKAAELTTRQFTEYIENQSGLSGRGETESASFTLYGSKAEIDELKEHLADQGFKEWSGADRPIAMILAAIQEATNVFTRPAPAEALQYVEPPEETGFGETSAEGDW